MQPQMTTLLAVSKGTSIVTESIFDNRFKYVDELSRMGASVKVESNTAIIDGVEKLTGATLWAPDLRAGAALVIAGLMADGYTIVEPVDYIERGYEDFENKMQQVGAAITKVDSEDMKAIRKFKLKVSDNIENNKSASYII
jgi:UDP-N-acetylglucosamine 1-carboxyvinyltransferase